MKKTLVALVIIGLSAPVFAKDAETVESVPTKKTNKADNEKSGISALVDNAVIEAHVKRALEAASSTSNKRLDAGTNTSDTQYETTKKELLNIKGEREEREFILQNVPPEVRILGEKEVSAYIDTNYVQPRLARAKLIQTTVPDDIRAQGDVAINAFLKTHASEVARQDLVKPETVVWTSSTASLSEVQPPKTVPSVTAPPLQAASPLTAVQTDAQKALSALGISTTTPKAKAKKKTASSPSPKLNVKVSRAILMGNTKKVDLTFKASLSGTASVDKTYENLSIGSIFEVGDAEYIVDNIETTAVTITNRKNKRSERVLIN